MVQNMGRFCQILWEGRGKVKRPFAVCAFARLRGGRKNLPMAAGRLERRDFPSGPAKRVRMGSTGVEGFFDFRRLGVASYHFIIFCFTANTFF